VSQNSGGRIEKPKGGGPSSEGSSLGVVWNGAWRKKFKYQKKLRRENFQEVRKSRRKRGPKREVQTT